MADATEVKIGGKSQEQVALELAKHLLEADGKYMTYGLATSASREEIKDAYREALKMVRNPFQH